MPLIQGGPPEWIWERTANMLRWELVPSQRPDGQTLFELRVQCGLEIMRLQFLTPDELNDLRAVLNGWAQQPAVRSERDLGTASDILEAGRPQHQEGVVSDPDFAARP
jgi:hypothetical protein